MNAIQLLIVTDTTAFIQRLKTELGDVSDCELADETPSGGTSVVLDGVSVDYKLVHSEGGGEGGGDSVVRVLEFKIGKQIVCVRTLGHYDSYAGTEWSGEWNIVYPREVKVIQYFN